MHCPHCDFEIEKTFLRCPSCLRKLKEPCTTCGRPLDPRWKICPYCESEVGQRRRSASREGPRRAPAARRLLGSQRQTFHAGAGRTAGQPHSRPSSQRPAAHPSAQPRPQQPGPAAAAADAGVPRADAAAAGPLAPHPDKAQSASWRVGQLPICQLANWRNTGRYQRTLILVKPDAFARGLTGEILARFERKGLQIVALKHMTTQRELAEEHYAEHSEKPFFGELVDFITGGPLVALVLEGHEADKAARQLIGATNPLEAAPGSIRGDYGLEVQTNLVHGSDSDESAEREIGLWFPEL